MMLRRLKEDVEKNLAPKQETIIEVCVNDAHVLVDPMDKDVDAIKYLTVLTIRLS